MAQTIISETAVVLNAGKPVDANAPVGPVLKMVNGQPMVSSREVADHFGKRHADLIRSIQAVVRNCPEEFGERNFAFSEYTDSTGRKLPFYLLTRDGFVIVAMGFTGKKAIMWKIAYVQAFNAMEAELARHLDPEPTGPIIPRLTTAQERNPLAVLVNKLMGEQGPTRPNYIAFWKRFHAVFGVKSVDEVTVDQLPRAIAFVDALLAFRDGPGPKTLPPARRRNTLDDYKNLYRELPESMQYWSALMTRFCKATDVFGDELEAVKREATRPFRVGRKSDVQTYLDSAISPMYDLFSVSSDQLRITYRCVYDALEGCQNIWSLLRKG